MGCSVHDDRTLFEFLILEGAQAGLSWETILKKRNGYRRAFDQSDVEIISTYSESKIETLLQNSNIIRNRLKVNSTVLNAKLFLDVRNEFAVLIHIFGNSQMGILSKIDLKKCLNSQ